MDSPVQYLVASENGCFIDGDRRIRAMPSESSMLREYWFGVHIV